MTPSEYQNLLCLCVFFCAGAPLLRLFLPLSWPRGLTDEEREKINIDLTGNIDNKQDCDLEQLMFDEINKGLRGNIGLKLEDLTKSFGYKYSRYISGAMRENAIQRELARKTDKQEEKTMDYELVRPFSAQDILDAADDKHCDDLWRYVKNCMKKLCLSSFSKQITNQWLIGTFSKQITNQWLIGTFYGWLKDQPPEVEQFLIDKGFIRKKEEKRYKLGSVWRRRDTLYLLVRDGDERDMFNFVNIETGQRRCVSWRSSSPNIEIPSLQGSNKDMKHISNSIEEYYRDKFGGVAAGSIVHACACSECGYYNNKQFLHCNKYLPSDMRKCGSYRYLKTHGTNCSHYQDNS